mgnify:CR=1 FL=1
MTIYSNNQYYEAIFQLRPKNLEVLEIVKKYIEQDKALISKEIHKKFGVDLYLNKKKAAVHIARKLKKRYKGETKISKSLYGVDRMTSKRVYRVTVLFRLNEK